MQRINFPLFSAVILIGLCAGLGAAALTLIIHGIENLAFGHNENLYRIVTDNTSAERRLFALIIGGVAVSLGWYWLQRKGKAVVGIKAMISAETAQSQHPPLKEGILHTLLQIVAVGCGAP